MDTTQKRTMTTGWGLTIKRPLQKAEHLSKGAHPRFIVTSLMGEDAKPQDLYEKIYRARGETENRIKECQLDLMADRTSKATPRGVLASRSCEVGG